jgi:hypothetical protein
LAIGLILTLFLLGANRGAWGQSWISAEDSSGAAPAQSSLGGDVTVGDASLIQSSGSPQKKPLSDLTLGNFFSAGWDDDFAMRTRASGTPDLTLLRVQTNYLLRDFRGNFYEESNIASTTKRDLTNFDALIDYGFNRRVMIQLSGAYQWIDPRTGDPTASGGSPGILARIQLIDTESSSCCLNLKANAPNAPLGTTQSTLSYGLAGFEDLARFNLYRVGLYYSLTFDSYAGPVEAGGKQNDVQYCVALAKTITDPDTPIFGKLSLLLENFAQTDLSGSEAGRTLVTVTPGIRFNFGPCQDMKMGSSNAIIFGTDIPISTYRPWEAIYRLSYIKYF